MIPRGQGIDSPTVHDLQREVDELKVENERLKVQHEEIFDILFPIKAMYQAYIQKEKDNG